VAYWPYNSVLSGSECFEMLFAVGYVVWNQHR